MFRPALGSPVLFFLRMKQRTSQCYVQPLLQLDCGFVRCCETHVVNLGSVHWAVINRGFASAVDFERFYHSQCKLAVVIVVK